MSNREENQSGSVIPWLIVAIGVAALIYLSLGWVTFYRNYRRYAKEPQAIALPVIPNEAIVVLTGDQKRIPKGIQLLRRRSSPLLIISGTGRNTTLTDLVNQQGDAAVYIHEIWKKILLEPKATSTIENAEETAKIVKARGIRRLILVTSDYHMQRSLLIFHRLLPQTEIIPYAVSSAPPQGSDIKPEIDNETRVWVEYLKFFIVTNFVLARL